MIKFLTIESLHKTFASLLSAGKARLCGDYIFHKLGELFQTLLPFVGFSLLWSYALSMKGFSLSLNLTLLSEFYWSVFGPGKGLHIFGLFLLRIETLNLLNLGHICPSFYCNQILDLGIYIYGSLRSLVLKPLLLTELDVKGIFRIVKNALSNAIGVGKGELLGIEKSCQCKLFHFRILFCKLYKTQYLFFGVDDFIAPSYGSVK